MRDAHEFVALDAHHVVSVPAVTDDKYSRGVVGFVTGSEQYPGAAVLGVSGAARTGVGMVRYLGPDSVSRLVLERRPETVLGAGHVQSWVIGSGISALTRTVEVEAQMAHALSANVPVVMDAGALDLVADAPAPYRVIITPHVSELSRLMTLLTGRPAEWAPDVIASDPGYSACRVADELGVVVSLKGHVTHIAAPAQTLAQASTQGSSRTAFQVTAPTTWLATAGTGDVLAGMMGAMLATFRPETSHDLARCAATAVYIHGRAAAFASAGGPIAALDVAEAIPAVMREVLSA